MAHVVRKDGGDDGEVADGEAVPRGVANCVPRVVGVGGEGRREVKVQARLRRRGRRLRLRSHPSRKSPCASTTRRTHSRLTKSYVISSRVSMPKRRLFEIFLRRPGAAHPGGMAGKMANGQACFAAAAAGQENWREVDTAESMVYCSINVRWSTLLCQPSLCMLTANIRGGRGAALRDVGV